MIAQIYIKEMDETIRNGENEPSTGYHASRATCMRWNSIETTTTLAGSPQAGSLCNFCLFFLLCWFFKSDFLHSHRDSGRGSHLEVLRGAFAVERDFTRTGIALVPSRKRAEKKGQLFGWAIRVFIYRKKHIQKHLTNNSTKSLVFFFQRRFSYFGRSVSLNACQSGDANSLFVWRGEQMRGAENVRAEKKGSRCRRSCFLCLWALSCVVKCHLVSL